MSSVQDPYISVAYSAQGRLASPPPTVPNLHPSHIPQTQVAGIPPASQRQAFVGGSGAWQGSAGAERWHDPRQQPQQERHQQQPLIKPVAAQVAEQALMDPAMREAVKQQAMHLGGHALAAGKYYGHQGMMVFQDYIQQGPRGISILCFLGGIATSVVGFMSVCNFFGSIMDPFHYILCSYMFMFGLVTAVVEADPDSIGMLIPPIDRLAGPVTHAQAWLHDQCLFNALMGVICIMTSFGIKPDVEYMAVGLLGPQRYASSETSSESDAGGAALFQRAAAAWRHSKEQLAGKACRELWALHQQSTVGDCNVPKPTGMFNGSEKEQWRLWTSLKGVPAEDAKAMFVERLQREDLRF